MCLRCVRPCRRTKLRGHYMMCTAPLLAGCCRRQIFEWVKAHGGEPIIPFSGIFENKLFDMPADEKEAYCKEVHVALCFNTAPVNLGQHAFAVHF